MDGVFNGTYMKAQAQQQVGFKTTSLAHIHGSKTCRKESRYRSYAMEKFSLKEKI
jgi:hypothetical protein